jgi:hypothetical protein
MTASPDSTASVSFATHRRVVVGTVQGLVERDLFASVRWLALAQVQTSTMGLVFDFSGCEWAMPRGVAYGSVREYQDMQRVLGARPVAVVGSKIVADSIEASQRLAATLGIMSRAFASSDAAVAWCEAHYRVLRTVRPAARSGRALLKSGGLQSP